MTKTTEPVSTRRFVVAPFDGPQDTEPYAVYERGNSSARHTGTLEFCNAEALREEAAANEQDAADSFDRCDTDGFVSQWASQQMAGLHRAQADIAEHGGRWTFERVMLETTDGEPVADARQVQTRYGRRWRVDSADAWLPFRPARESTLGKRGYREVVVEEIAPARAIHWSPPGARGLSGATSVQVVIIRTDRPKAEGWQPCGAPEA